MLSVMALDRFAAVFRPYTYSNSRKTAICYSICVVVTSGFIAASFQINTGQYDTLINLTIGFLVLVAVAINLVVYPSIAYKISQSSIQSSKVGNKRSSKIRYETGNTDVCQKGDIFIVSNVGGAVKR